MKNGSKDEFVTKHIECPCGTSSDAFCIRSDKSGFCFSCGENFTRRKLESLRPEGGESTNLPSLDSGENNLDVTKDIIGFRGISKKTAQFYGVETKFVDEEEYERAFPFGDAIKIKNVENKKKQRVIGPFSSAGLFGQDLFDDGSKPGIIITEGEEDALAAYEMLMGKLACESIKSGAPSAKSCLQASWQHINSFDKIYICFDNDTPGKEALKSIQGLFDYKKVYYVKLGKYKDANDYLLAGEVSEFQSIVENSRRYAPSSIISTYDEFKTALTEGDNEVICDYPFPELQEMTGGIKEDEVIILKAMEGVGKTALFKELEHHLLENTDIPIALIHLEEPNQRTLKSIAGHKLGVNASRIGSGVSNEEVLETIKGYEGRLYVHKPYDVDDEDSFFGTIRYLVSAMGCKVVFWDHISWVATSTLDNEDERKKLDRMSRKAKTLATELGFCFIIISHVNDDGKTRGSRSITKDADTVINLDRDLESNSPILRIFLEKNRLGADTGRAGEVFYDRTSGRLLAEKPEIDVNE